MQLAGMLCDAGKLQYRYRGGIWLTKSVDKYIIVRYNITIEVRYITLKGKRLWMHI
jgi:hypothetical protein